MERVLTITLVILAVLATATAIALGVNARTASKRGPRWRRWLFNLGLAGLTAVGCTPAEAEDKSPAKGPQGQDKPAGSTKTTGWPAIDQAFAYARPLAESGKSSSIQRRTAKDKLDQALKAAKTLFEQGKMSAQELSLLKLESDTLNGMIRSNPPTDHQVKCYKRAFLPPARQSMERLEQRLPLVEGLVKGGKVNSKVADKVISTMEKDLKVLNNDRNLNRLKGDERVKAVQTRQAMEQKLSNLKKLMNKQGD